MIRVGFPSDMHHKSRECYAGKRAGQVRPIPCGRSSGGDIMNVGVGKSEKNRQGVEAAGFSVKTLIFRKVENEKSKTSLSAP